MTRRERERFRFFLAQGIDKPPTTDRWLSAVLLALALLALAVTV